MTLNDMKIFLLFAVLLFWVNIKQLSIKSGISTFECLKRNKIYVYGLLLFIGFVCCNVYINNRREKDTYRNLCETSVARSFFTVKDNGVYGMTINIHEINKKFKIDIMNCSYSKIEKWSKEKYMIWKNADSDTLYFEKGNSNWYVIIAKPKEHWYDY